MWPRNVSVLASVASVASKILLQSRNCAKYTDYTTTVFLFVCTAISKMGRETHREWMVHEGRANGSSQEIRIVCLSRSKICCIIKLLDVVFNA